MKRLIHTPQPEVVSGAPLGPAPSALPAVPRARHPGEREFKEQVQRRTGRKARRKQTSTPLTGEHDADTRTISEVFFISGARDDLDIPGVVAEACLESLRDCVSGLTMSVSHQPSDLQTAFAPLIPQLAEVQTVLRLLESSVRHGLPCTQYQNRWEKAVRGVLREMRLQGQLPSSAGGSVPAAIHLPWLTLAELQLEVALTSGLSPSTSYVASFVSLRQVDLWKTLRGTVAEAIRADALQPGRKTTAPLLTSSRKAMLKAFKFSPDEEFCSTPATKLGALRGAPPKPLTVEDRLCFDPGRIGVPDIVLRTYFEAIVPSYCEFDPPMSGIVELREWLAPAKPELMSYWRVLRQLEEAVEKEQLLLTYRNAYAKALRDVTSALVSTGRAPADLGDALAHRSPPLPWEQLAGWLIERRAVRLAHGLPWKPEAVKKKVHAAEDWRAECQRIAADLQRDAARTLGRNLLPFLVDAAAIRVLQSAGFHVR